MTPLYKIQIPKSNASVWAKLESANPTGTHKDRSIGPWILHYAKQGIREFAISSSGNSALSAARYCAENGLKVHTFVSPDSPAIPRLRREKAVIHITRTPRKDALRFSKANTIVNLRASTDDNALLGYKDIAFELMEQLPHIDNIFIPTSSGATLQGMYNGYAKKQKIPAFFVVQTTKVHPIAGYFDKNFVGEKTSHATAIVDNIAHRRDRLLEIIKETGGGGFVISNQELEEARKILCGVSDTPHKWQSALAFAGFLRWQKQNRTMAANEISVCLFTD